jgi:hypothetical protein
VSDLSSAGSSSLRIVASMRFFVVVVRLFV